jgi:hypothetical protein
MKDVIKMPFLYFIIIKSNKNNNKYSNVTIHYTSEDVPNIKLFVSCVSAMGKIRENFRRGKTFQTKPAGCGNQAAFIIMSCHFTPPEHLKNFSARLLS